MRCQGTSSTRAHGARSISTAYSSLVTHSGAMPLARAFVQRRRTVVALLGEYCASHPILRPPGPVTSTSVTVRPSEERASVCACRPWRDAAWAMRSFMALCLSLSSGVAT
jgi:hypothetical protein